MKETSAVARIIENKILLIRGEKVMLDFHLAELYDVETKALKRAVRRNRMRFPEDFISFPSSTWKRWFLKALLHKTQNRISLLKRSQTEFGNEMIWRDFFTL